jgi:hypothetical protein
MRIENLRSEKNDSRSKVAATIVWEDCNRPSQEIYFETTEEFAEDFIANPHAFLVACTMPAMRFGEERIFIDAEICPELNEGLITVMNLFQHWFDWYKQKTNLVRIECRLQNHVSPGSRIPRAAFLFSGGIDSLATLRANRLNYGMEHPLFIRDGVLIYGLEVRQPENFEYVLESISILAQDAGVALIPVYTNIRDLGPESGKIFWNDFWLNEFIGATFAAVAHTLSKRFGVLSINSTHDVSYLIPYGSHPLIDPKFSSNDLRIRHEGIHLTRFAKAKLISDWDLAMQHLRVCNRSEFYRSEMLNCGQCEKCVRTMLAFEALGVMKKASAFSSDDVTEELVDSSVQLEENIVPLYRQLLEPLAKVGRNDLRRATERKITEFYREQKKQKIKGQMESIVEFDRKYLKGGLKKLKNSVFDRKLVT